MRVCIKHVCVSTLPALHTPHFRLESEAHEQWSVWHSKHQQPNRSLNLMRIKNIENLRHNLDRLSINKIYELTQADSKSLTTDFGRVATALPYFPSALPPKNKSTSSAPRSVSTSWTLSVPAFGQPEINSR